MSIDDEQAAQITALAVGGDPADPATWIARMMAITASQRRIAKLIDALDERGLDHQAKTELLGRAADELVAHDRSGLTRERMGQLLEVTVRCSLAYARELQYALRAMPFDVPPGPRPARRTTDA